MKTVGVIGGIGPESTIEYYRFLVAAYRAQNPDGSYPPIIINSINLKAVVDLLEANDLAGVTERFVAEIQKLAAAGAECGLLAANTPHIVFDEIRRRSPIALVSIVEATRDAAKIQGLKRPVLLGTRFTMQREFYPRVFNAAGISLVVPQPDEQTYIHDKYMNELLNDTFLPETRERFLAIADDVKARDGIEALILGGTEIPLLLRDAEHNGMPLLDTTKIHVERLVRELLS
jgi:aspartate racemase